MTTKVRLYWFWRGAIATLAGAAGILAVFYAGSLLLGSSSGISSYVITINVVGFLLMPMPAIITYGLLARRFGPQVSDGQNHCHRCGYILRGLSEPRCPECGEAI